MKKRIIIALLIGFACAVGVQAQIFWKVSGKGLAKPSYLFGTHHLIEKDQLKDFDKVLNYAGQADVVVGEMDMTDMVAMQNKMMQAAVMSGTTIKELLNAEDYALVDAEFKQLIGAGLGQLGILKPMMLQTMYASLIYLKSQNLTKQPEGVDMLFQKKAKENNKAVIGLETIEQQTAILFDFLPLKRQADLLVKSVKEKQKGIEMFKRLNAAYLIGDLKKISDIDAEDDDLTAEERKPLYENRNDAWMKQLPALFAKQSCFVAVGCMHLIGDSGLVAQLKKAGYTVEAVVW